MPKKDSKISDKRGTEKLILKKQALCLTDKECFAKVEKSDGDVRKIHMVAYSGGIIPDHWYWDNLVIDTSGMKISKKGNPVLEEHIISQKVGFGTFVKDGISIIAKDVSLLSTEYAEEFAKLSDEGFLYQASIRARPKKIQRLLEKETTEVNGFVLKGPGTVWRESELIECSICTFGADPNTKSEAMTEDEEMAVEVQGIDTLREEEVNMDLETLKTQHPDLYNQIFADGKKKGEDEAAVTFSEERTQLQGQIDELTARGTQLSEDNSKVSERLLALEKAADLQREASFRARADSIFAEEASDLPDRLRPKVRKMVDHNSFITDDKFDEGAFREAVKNELKDWTPEEGQAGTVLGFGIPRAGSEESLSETQTDELVDRMLGHTGQASQTIQ